MLFCDSEASLARSRADGLWKVRHVDLRVCFVQDQLRRKELLCYGVRGTVIVADIFTKNLDYSTTLRRMKSLGLQAVGIAAVSCELGCLLSLLGCACVGRQHVSLEDRYC